MRNHIITVPVLLVAAMLFSAYPSWATWLDNGTPVCRADYNQEDCQVVSDGSGGAIIVWEDYRPGLIYAQRIDGLGNVLWEEDGVSVCTNPGDRWFTRATADGNGGVFVVWYDYRSTFDTDIYAQRLDGAGNRLWGDGGLPVCTIGNNQYYPDVVHDGSGGCFIVWNDNRSPSTDIYAQRVNAGGTTLWTTNGIPVCTAVYEQGNPVVTNDGNGNAIIAWEDYRNGSDYDIFAQKVTGSGSTSWTSNGIVICSYGNPQLGPRIVADGTGGACVCWMDSRYGVGFDIFVQRIDVAGTVQWAANGRNIGTTLGDQQNPSLVSDGKGGAIIAWNDDRGADADIYIQRINSSGSQTWQSSGVPLCTAVNIQRAPKLALDGAGGAIVVWGDMRYGDWYIYAQAVDAYGMIRWTVNGIQVAGGAESQYLPDITIDDTGGAIIAWQDYRSNAHWDISSQRIDHEGNWGVPEPRIRAVRDVPGDQGGQVNLSWYASLYDPVVALITNYTVWRAIDPEEAMLLIGHGAYLCESASEAIPSSDCAVIRFDTLSATEYFWSLVGSHDAYYLETYSLVASTLFDSTAVSDEYHYFQVIAHTSVPDVFFTSDPDSGYSVDNLAPCPPQCLAGEQSYVPEGLQIEWHPNIEADLDCYHVYRGTGSGFVPGLGNLIGSPCDTLLFDGEWRWDSGYCYKVAAVDVHGNESDYTLLCSEDVTGEDIQETPVATYLAQNFPNPFNPVTTIRFGLKQTAHVQLRIYDASGRLVRVLVDESRAASLYEEVWDGRDGAGREVASGIYFYRLVAGDFVQTKKMVLLR